MYLDVAEGPFTGAAGFENDIARIEQSSRCLLGPSDTTRVAYDAETRSGKLNWRLSTISVYFPAATRWLVLGLS